MEKDRDAKEETAVEKTGQQRTEPSEAREKAATKDSELPKTGSFDSPHAS
jgi:hypothetical protein